MRKMKVWLWLVPVLTVLLLTGCADRNRIRIYTPAQLLEMVETANTGDAYVLMADIDLAGQEWTPVDFAGKLDGNGKTISNVTISRSVNGNAGFFAGLTGTVENLHFQNICVTADEATQYAGLLAGTNGGRIRNCTVTGSITDQRQETACVGVFVGRNDGGNVFGGADLLTASAGSPNPEDQVAGLSASVAVYLSDGKTVGIAGRTRAEDVDTTMLWRDTSGSFDGLPEGERQRRQQVVDMMYQMGTVQWTVSEQISYTSSNNRQSTHSNMYLPGRTYIGIPYNGCEGSYERFLTQMQLQTDEQGRLVTVTGLEDGIKTKSGEFSGFILDMGNDCAGAVLWALSAGVPYNVEDGGIEAPSAPYMIPNAYNTQTYGVLPVGGYQVIEGDTSKYSTGEDARDGRTVIQLNGGGEAMAEYYAKAYRGDYLIYVAYTYNAETDTWKRTGNHARLLAYEPMIVRKWDGTVNLEESYVITHEQGDGLYDNRLENGEYEVYQGYNLKQTSWRTDHKYTLSVLLTAQGYNNDTSPGCGYGYVPVTLAAYSAQEVPTLQCQPVQPVTLPNTGVYEANYLVTHATMVITDGAGKTVYEKTAYLPYRQFRDFLTVDLAQLFPDADDALQAGQTYRQTLTLSATGGRTCTVMEDQLFTN